MILDVQKVSISAGGNDLGIQLADCLSTALY